MLEGKMEKKVKWLGVHKTLFHAGKEDTEQAGWDSEIKIGYCFGVV